MQTITLNTSEAGRRYGAIASWHDPRDWTLPYRVKMTARPPSTDLSKWLGPVKDQGPLGACTGFGSSGQMEFLDRKYGSPAGTSVFSPMDIYWNERDMEGSVDEDSGAQIRTACRVLTARGVCLESEDPYQPKNFRVPPAPLQIAEAAQHKAGAYHRLGSLEDMQLCLASGYTFLMGFLVYASFEGIGADGVMPMPKSKEPVLGGHCVLVWGYDDPARCLKVRNSWGPGWGSGGNFYMNYDYAADSSKVFDSWVVHKGKPW